MKKKPFHILGYSNNRIILLTYFSVVMFTVRVRVLLFVVLFDWVSLYYRRACSVDLIGGVQYPFRWVKRRQDSLSTNLSVMSVVLSLDFLKKDPVVENDSGNGVLGVGCVDLQRAEEQHELV